jgi:uncharacterized membrane protein SirB2
MLIKIIHMSVGTLAILLFITRAVLGARSSNGRLSSAGLERFFKIAPHIVYSVIVGCGLYLLLQLPQVYPHWLIAKMVLFVVAVSASTKAFKVTATREQFKRGVLVAAVAYAGMIGLIVVKPNGAVVTQPVAVSAPMANQDL